MTKTTKRLVTVIERILTAKEKEQMLLAERDYRWEGKANMLFQVECLRQQSDAVRSLVERQIGLSLSAVCKDGRVVASLVNPAMSAIARRAYVQFNAENLRTFLWRFADVDQEQAWLDEAQAESRYSSADELIARVVKSVLAKFNRRVWLSTRQRSLDDFLDMLERYAKECEYLTSRMSSLVRMCVGI